MQRHLNSITNTSLSVSALKVQFTYKMVVFVFCFQTSVTMIPNETSIRTSLRFYTEDCSVCLLTL